MTDLVTIGESLGLFRASGIGPLTPGDATVFSFAGAESNVSIGMARLGHQVAMVQRIGDDAVGRVIADRLRAEGVSLAGFVTDPDAPTSFMLRQNRTADRVTVSYYRHGSAGSRLRRDDLDPGLIRTARILHTTGITMGISPSARDAATYAFDLAHEAGATVSLDINHRSRLWSAQEAGETLRALIGKVDVVFGSDDELRLLADGDTPEELAAAVRDLGPAEVVLKRGQLGALARAGSETVSVPVVPVTGVDPVGAGDAFVAGYLSARLEGQDVVGRLRRGAVCGAFAVSVPGDWEGLPRRAELDLLAGTENVRR